MAKELPYFKFNCTEWMTGQIAFEPLEVQGLFVNICALYWKNLGVLGISQIEQRYKKKKIIDKLSGRFFSVSSGFISIAFLDEQLHERDALSEKNKINGSLGGRPKKNQNNPPLLKNNPLITQTKPKKSNIEREVEVEGEGEVLDSSTQPIIYSEISTVVLKYISDKCPTVSKMRQPFTHDEIDRLIDEFGKDKIKEYLNAMENYVPLLSKSKSANLTIRKWMDRDRKVVQSKQSINLSGQL